MLRATPTVLISALALASIGCEDPAPTLTSDGATVGSAGSAEPIAGVSGEPAAGAGLGGEQSAGADRAGDPMSGGTWVSGQEAGAEQAGGSAGASTADAGSDEGGSQGMGGVIGGAQTDVEPPVMEEEVSCLRSCVDFVECAIDSCEGYDDSDTRFLMDECLSVCLDPIAQAFDRLKNCNDKLRFAFTIRPDFGQYCGSLSEGFCETFVETCGPWTGEESCEAHYNDAPERGPELSAGANRACYEYHLGDARRSLNRGEIEASQLSCEHAAGLSVCVD